LHGIAKGLSQLHGAGISHQDLKPSNVMTFGVTAKVGDLGRSTDGRDGSLFAGPEVQGDSLYAPPELLYEDDGTSGQVRRRACDLYHLGSMTAFLVTGSGMTPLIFNELDQTYHHSTWPKPYANVLQFVRDAYDRALSEIEHLIPEPLRGPLLTLLREMCDPDPVLRGNPRGGSGVARYDINRYVSKFDLLAKRADIALGRSLTK
jgi:serine/threonine protein kinase